MDTPGKGKKKKGRGRNKVLQRQRRYRQRKQAAVDGIDEVRARNRQRYYVRMAHVKATGQYEAFKTKKSKEGAYEEYRRRLNARRRQQMAEKKRAMGIEEWREICHTCRVKATQKVSLVGRASFLYRGCRWTGQSPSLRRRRTRCKPFVRTRCSN